jgi:hypothetical protein
MLMPIIDPATNMMRSLRLKQTVDDGFLDRAEPLPDWERDAAHAA